MNSLHLLFLFYSISSLLSLEYLLSTLSLVSLFLLTDKHTCRLLLGTEIWHCFFDILVVYAVLKVFGGTTLSLMWLGLLH